MGKNAILGLRFRIAVGAFQRRTVLHRRDLIVPSGAVSQEHVLHQFTVGNGLVANAVKCEIGGRFRLRDLFMVFRINRRIASLADSR